MGSAGSLVVLLSVRGKEYGEKDVERDGSDIKETTRTIVTDSFPRPCWEDAFPWLQTMLEGVLAGVGAPDVAGLVPFQGGNR